MMSVVAVAFAPALVLPSAYRAAAPARVEAANMKLNMQPVLAGFLAAAITLSPIDAAWAASKSGGRVGGRVSSAPTTMKAAPKPSTSSSPSSSSSSSSTRSAGTRVEAAKAAAPAAPAPQVTNIYQTAPMGGYGYGAPMMGGGYGYGGGGGGGMGLFIGVEIAEMFLKEQQRQAYLKQQLATQQQLGADKAAIESLQRQLTEQNAKMDNLRAQQPAPPGQSGPMTEDQLKLQLQVLQQQKELEQMKAGNLAVAK